MDDLTFIDGLRRANSEALSFIPFVGINEYLASGRYIIQKGDGKRVGYLLHSVPQTFGVLKIAQACIDFDWREKGYGHDVLKELESRAKHWHCGSISLRCAENLGANAFWLANGYHLVETLHPKNRRKRAINVYEKIIIPTLFEINQYA